MNDGKSPMDAEDRPLSVFGESANGFPKLPILSPAEIPPPGQRGETARSQFEKYGGLFYLGIAGLAVLAVLVGWFAFRLWNLRDVWTEVYVLHDPAHSELDRVRAAFRLAQDPRVNDAQRMEMSLKRDAPDLARYLLAESVSTDAVAHDPRSFALTVARSPDWPDWLRLLLTRQLAYGSARGYAIPREALTELASHSDPMIGLWADCGLTLLPQSDPKAAGAIEQAEVVPGPTADLAALLRAATAAPPPEREGRLNDASLWLRHHHPQSAKIWQGWKIADGQIDRDGAN
jgi:hypothetical protein